MSQTITEQDVRHIARLSRLKLSDQEVAHFAQQLGKVLDYVGKLQELDVEGVEPMVHPAAMSNVLRSDEPGPVLTVDEALANAPDRDESFFKVPRILGGGAGA